jgi:hypothetical protein
MAVNRIGLSPADFTSPRWGEVDLLLPMRSIVQCKSGEGAFDKRDSVTPHPNPLPTGEGARCRCLCGSI